jgi:hypothetical protein
MQERRDVHVDIHVVVDVQLELRLASPDKGFMSGCIV